MKRLVSIVCIAVLAVSAAFAGGAQETTDSSKKEFKVAVQYGVGGLGDKRFNDNINNDVLAAKDTLGFSYDYVEPRAVSEFESFLHEFAESNEYNLVIVAGSDAADATSKVAKEFPNQHFLLVDSASQDSNVVGLTFKDNEATFLGGYAASKITKTNKIGVIGALDIDVINGFLAGWEGGAKYGNPDITVFRSYCGGFADPVTAKEMAIQMYNNGADIVFGAAGGSGLGIFQAAEETGHLAVGVDSNQNPVKPDYIVMSCIRSFSSIIPKLIEEEKEGTLPVGQTLAVGIADDAVDCVFDGSNVPVPQEVKDEIATLKKDVKAGKVDIPTHL